MATLDPLHAIQSAVIETLSDHYPIAMSDLYGKITEQFNVQISKQNLYRTVAQLIAAQVLVREKGSLSLNRIWARHIVMLGEILKRNYFSDRGQASKFPGAASRSKVFKAGSLAQLDPIWTDVLVELSEHVKGKKLFGYNSHPWYSIGMRDTEQRVMKGLVEGGIQVYLMYGNDSFLDRYGKRLIEFPGYHTVCVTQKDFPPEGYALWVGGPYLIEVEFPAMIARQFKFIFDTIQAPQQLDIELFSDIFKVKAQCSLRLTHDPARAVSTKKRIEKYFK